MTTPRFSGRLTQAYTVTVPSDPGWAQPDRHSADAAGGGIDRDDAATGGGWQPASWGDTSNLAGLYGNTLPRVETGHTRTPGHTGPEGRGAGQERVILDSADGDLGGDRSGILYGAGGAANGGLVASGSAPWMSPGASRRRADGGLVTREPGFKVGHWHITVRGNHRQGLHLNRPTIRGVREKQITRGTEPAIRSVGPVAPSGRTTIPPYTTPGPAAPVVPSILGQEYVL